MSDKGSSRVAPEVKESVVKGGEGGKEGKGGGEGNGTTVRREHALEENGASSTTPSSVDLDL